MTKETMRQEFLSLRDSLPEDSRLFWSAQIREHILNYIKEHGPDILFSYCSFRSEPDTFRLMEQLLSMGKTLALPKCEKGGVMEFFRVRRLEDLKKGAYGILEPTAEEKLSPEKAELILVPGCAFSKEGHRLGYGGGYYDRYLPKATRAKRLGVCFSACLAEEIPTTAFDSKMDGIFTEQMFVNFL